MFNEIRQLGTQSLIYGTAHIAGRALTFLLLPVFTHHLTPQQFGVYNLYFLLLGLSTELILLGQHITLLNLYEPQEPLLHRQRLFSSIINSILLFGLLYSAVLWLGSRYWIKWVIQLPPPYPQWSIYTLKICALLILVDVLKILPLNVLRREERAGQFALINISGIVIQTVLTVLFLVLWKRGVPGIYEAQLISSASILLFSLPVLVRLWRPSFSGESFRRCIAFGLPLLPNALFVFAIELSDRKILELIRGSAEVGLYSAGYKLGMFIAIATMALRFAWQPFFQAKKHIPHAPHIFARVLTYGLAIGVWIYLLLTAFVNPLVKSRLGGIGPLIDAEYWDGLEVFPIILLAHLFNIAHLILSAGLYLTGRTKLFPYISGLALMVNVGGNLLLIPYWGMYGAAWMTVVAYGLMTILLYFCVQRYYPLPVEWRRVMHIVVMASLTYAMGEVGRRMGTGWLGYGLSPLFPLLLYLSGLATASERGRLREMFSRIGA